MAFGLGSAKRKDKKTIRKTGKKSDKSDSLAGVKQAMESLAGEEMGEIQPFDNPEAASQTLGKTLEFFKAIDPNKEGEKNIEEEKFHGALTDLRLRKKRPISKAPKKAMMKEHTKKIKQDIENEKAGKKPPPPADPPGTMLDYST